MNKKQLAYQIGRVYCNYYDILFSALAGGYAHLLARLSAQFFSQARDIRDLYNIPGALLGLLAISLGIPPLLSGKARLLSYLESKEIEGNPDKYPLEHAVEVILDDVNGLEMLLEKTAEGGDIEWGTFLNAYDDRRRAVIYHILDPNEAKKLGLVGKGSTIGMDLRIKKAEEEGYDGHHHYHPDEILGFLGAMNFNVSFIDRNQSKNWINLLTFNLPEGPEIIGFNRKRTYIPTDDTKRRLALATPEQIMEYLA